MERAFFIYQISNFSGLSAGGIHPPFLFFLKKRNGPCTVQREIALAQNGALRLFCLRRLVERDGAVQTWLLSAGCAGQGARAGLRRRIWGLGCNTGVVIARLSATSPAAAALALPDDSNERGFLSRGRYPKHTAATAQPVAAKRAAGPYRFCRPTSQLQFAGLKAENLGVPAKTQRSGFRGERPSIGRSELLAQTKSEGYGDCEDRAQRRI